MERVVLLLLLVGFSANVSGQPTESCDSTCQSNCATKFSECYTSYPQDPTAAGACSVIQSVESCIKQKVGPECRTVPGLTISLQSIENATRQICDHGRCNSEFSKCYELFPQTSGTFNCDDILTADTKRACSAMQETLSCLQQNLPATCRTAPGVEVSIQVIENATAITCHTSVACGQELTKCMCLAYPPGASLLQEIHRSALCERWPVASKCFDAIPDACTSNSDSRQDIEVSRHSLERSYYAACDPKGGVCPETLECFASVSFDRQNASAEGDGGYAAAEFRKICRMTPAFDCLNNVSLTCNIDQGSVTFGQIKGLVMDLCDDILPHANRMFQCPQFLSCVNGSMLPGLQSNHLDQDSVEDQWKEVHAAVSVTRTGFWCSALQSVYKCALENADQCGIQSLDTEPAKQQYNRLTSMCVGAATVPPLTERNIREGPNSGAKTRTQSELSLILLSAILITWLSR